MKKVLITGARGQIGSELVPALRARLGTTNVVATDVRIEQDAERHGPFEYLDATDVHQIRDMVRKHDISVVYHLAALLSATAEQKPHVAWQLNMDGLYQVLEVARGYGCSVFFPSSIGAFGPGTPRQATPQDTVQRPNTMYGVTKVAGELLCDYYHHRFGVDTRGVRFPGLISWTAPPGGGTTDYAVEIFHAALRHGRYTCFLRPDARLDMMYMPDAIRAVIGVMEADPKGLVHRNAFNVTAMNFTPAELAVAIRKHVPGFSIDYEVDPVRQAIADSWPESIDDSAAREEWDWQPQFDLESLVAEMITNLRRSLFPKP